MELQKKKKIEIIIKNGCLFLFSHDINIICYAKVSYWDQFSSDSLCWCTVFQCIHLHTHTFISSELLNLLSVQRIFTSRFALNKHCFWCRYLRSSIQLAGKQTQMIIKKAHFSLSIIFHLMISIRSIDNCNSCWMHIILVECSKYQSSWISFSTY